MKYLILLFTIIFGLIAALFIIGYFELIVELVETIKIPIVIEGTYEYEDIKWQLIGQNIGSFLIIVVSYTLFSYFFSLFRRLNKKKKDSFSKDSIKGPFVLYLRSFIDDKKTRKQISLFNDVRSEEEVLVEVMSDIAPVYAIGDPKDKKMPLGACRIYVDDNYWKSTVIELMSRAVAVVLRLGKTDSFWWEVETVIKNISLDKVIFVVPESKTFSNVSMLYKILLDHNIDIKNLNINIEKKKQGSISSFLYFDKNGQAVTKEVKIPLYTKIVLLYENILRNALSEFRVKYGFKDTPKRTIRWARLFEIMIFLWGIFFVVSSLFNDLVSLKYQMPYEFVEKCVDNVDFVNKYSNEVNGTNLTWGIVEARKGQLGLDDTKYKLLFLIESRAIQSVSYDEFCQLQTEPKNLLLMVKKYLPDSYNSYVEILSEAAIIGIQSPNKMEELIRQYKSNIECMPQWVMDFATVEDTQTMNEYESVLRFNSILVEHIDDIEIVDVIKTLYCQVINN